MPPTRSGGATSALVLPGAVSPLTLDLVTGPVTIARVVAVSRFGLYLTVGTRVLPLLTADAAALPTAVRLGVGSDGLAWGAAVGDEARLGSGAVVLPGLEVRAARTWRPSRVGLGGTAGSLPGPPPRPGAAAGGIEEVLRTVTAGSSWLVEPVRDAVRADDPGASVAALVGRGRGLTPSGDDALAGALLLRKALDPNATHRLADAVRARLHATTALSATLLDAAADGYAAPEVVALVDAVAAVDPTAVARALPPVLAIGHTSGRDLVAGLAGALTALAPPGRAAA